ncbi:MAG: cytochrome c oxidase subunit II [Hyphomicrobium sp.]|jgi:cytochrome c oxidase subunit 2|nr:cytochrome c oxidase subunit II [Hyphomicrobium sp.]PPD09502.1 MAG: cytochrome c oxidase subunit II [Hyphomicrobium sp.]
MTTRFWTLGALAILAAIAGAFGAADPALAVQGYSEPGQIGLQRPVTEVARDIHSFYDLVNIIIIAITLFVLGLMLYVMVRFRESKNPVPSKTTHNTLLEVAWTVVPILILVAIAIPSFKLLMLQYTYPKPDVTIKAIGNAWFWEHEYPGTTPEDKTFTVTSNMLSDEEVAEKAKATGLPVPRLLSVDNEIVVPVNKVVHMLVTSNDVIHNWTIPSFGSKIDAVPGRLTSTWFRAEEQGIFYGQCSELCGMNHAFMPIAVRVVSQDVYDQWTAALKAGDRKKAKEITDRVALEHAGVKSVADASDKN